MCIFDPDEGIRGFGILRLFQPVTEEVPNILGQRLPEARFILLVSAVNFEQEIPETSPGLPWPTRRLW